MSALLFVGLFSIYLLAMKPIFDLPMSPEVRLVAGIVLGIGAFIVPLVVFSLIDAAWWKRNVARVAKEWCASRSLDFRRAELHKNHFTAVASHGEDKVRRRFRMSRHFLVWKVKRVEWLDPDVAPP